ALALGYTGGIRAATLIFEALNSISDDVSRELAAYACKFTHDPRLTTQLVTLVKNQRELPNVRAQALESLGSQGSNAGFDYILEGLEDKEGRGRLWAAYALGEIGNPRAIPALLVLGSIDHTEIEHFWSVAQEANDAVQRISTKKGRSPEQ